MSIVINEVKAVDTFSVRHPVLRAGRPLQDCAMEGDDLETTFHLAAFEEGRMIGVATFLKASDELIIKQTKAHLKLAQLRGMAVLPASQGKGIGKLLINDGIYRLKSEGIEVLWFNARIKAVPFYEGFGFERVGTAFEVQGIGTHYKMYSYL